MIYFDLSIFYAAITKIFLIFTLCLQFLTELILTRPYAASCLQILGKNLLFKSILAGCEIDLSNEVLNFDFGQGAAKIPEVKVEV